MPPPPSSGAADASTAHVSEVTAGIHFAVNRRGRLRARLRRTQAGADATDLPTLLEGFPAEDVVVRGQIRARLDLNVLFAEGLFADRSLDERKFDRRAVESVSRIQREDAVPLRDGTPLDADTTYDLTPDADDPLPDAVRVAIPFITDHGGAVYARLDLDDRLRDTTDTEEFRDVFAGGKALVRGKVRATVDLAALFDARIVDGAVDPGTMYMPPSA
jgi:hypothetical protein